MRLIQEIEQAHHDKDSEAVDKEMVSESSNNEDDTETALVIKNRKTQIWNLKEIQTFHILKKFCSNILLKGNLHSFNKLALKCLRQ